MQLLSGRRFKKNLSPNETSPTALYGKHIRIQRPPKSTSTFYNYKSTYRKVLYAIVNVDYCFQYIDVENDYRSNNRSIVNHSTLKIELENELLKWPVGAIFALRMMLFVLRYIWYSYYSQGERIFNFRLFRVGRHVEENAFGSLANRFHIFSRHMYLKVERYIEDHWSFSESSLFPARLANNDF